jgi:hypothetical protein
MKPQKPGKPYRNNVPDYRCNKPRDPDELEEVKELCEEDGREILEYEYYEGIEHITLAELVSAYKECDLSKIIVLAYVEEDDRCYVGLERSETDEEFVIRLKQYESDLEKYNKGYAKWQENNNPEKKKEKIKAKKLAKIAKLKKEVEEL